MHVFKITIRPGISGPGGTVAGKIEGYPDAAALPGVLEAPIDGTAARAS